MTTDGTGVAALTILVVYPGTHGVTRRIAERVTATLTLPRWSARRLPTGGAQLSAGDFRDEEDIDPWAGSLARELPAPRSADAYTDPLGHVPR